MASLGEDAKGNRCIIDAAVADQEWQANTDVSRAPVAVKERAASAPVAVSPGTAGAVSPLTEASTREKEWRAKRAELDYKREAGELVDAKAVEATWSDILTNVRTKLLAIPGKVKAELPHLAHEDIVAVDRLLRDTLEDLSKGKPPDGGAAAGTAA